MLKVTNQAAEILKAARTNAGASGDAGLRIRRAEPPTSNGDAIALAFTFSDEPEPEDGTVEQEGLRVFVEQSLIEPLSERTLDVRATEQGAELVFR